MRPPAKRNKVGAVPTRASIFMKDAIQSQDERFDSLWLLQCKSDSRHPDVAISKWGKESIEKKYEVQLLVRDLTKRYFGKSNQPSQ